MTTENLIQIATPLVSLVGIVFTALAVNRPQKRIEAMMKAVELHAKAPDGIQADIETYLRVNAAKLADVKWRTPWGLLGVVIVGAGTLVCFVAVLLDVLTEVGATRWLYGLGGVYIVVGFALAKISSMQVMKREAATGATPAPTSGSHPGGSASATPAQPAPPTTTEQTSTPA